MPAQQYIFVASFVLLVCCFADRKGDQDIFAEWTKSNGIRLHDMKIQELPHSFGSEKQYGIFASADIPKNSLILEIPNEAMLNEATLRDSPCHKLIPSDQYLTATNQMALFLLHEKYNAESKWRPYIDFLPSHIHTTLFFTEEELQNLQNSTLVTNTRKRRENASYYYGIISKWIQESNMWNGEVFSEEEWLWALSILWSRAFSVKINGEPMGSLVPVADLFNAYNPYKDKLQSYIPVDSTLKYYTVEDITKGEEIMMPYGKYKKHSNAELLLDYAFVRPSNPDDLACVRNPYLHKEFSYSYEKKHALEQMNLWWEDYCWSFGEFPHELVWAMRIISFISSDIERYSIRKLKSLVRELESVDRTQPMNSVPFGTAKEITAVRLASSAIQKTLRSYGTTLEADMDLLEQQYYGKTSLSYPEYAAIVVRSGEKRILHGALMQLEEYSYFLNQHYTDDIII